MIMARRTLVALALFLLPLVSEAKPIEVVVGFMAKTPAAAEADFAGIFNHLRSSSDVKFDIRTFPTYEALYDAFVQKKLDFALVGAVKYVQAHFEIGAVPVIVEGGLVRSYIVVPKESPIKSAKELAGKSFGFGYKDSTSTHLMPLLLLSKNLIKEKTLGKVEFLGSDQQKIAETLLAGQVDAVGIVESVYRQFAARLRVLEKSEPFPGTTLIAQKSANPANVAAVRKVFLAHKGVGTGKRFEGVISADDAMFNQIRFLCKVLYGKTYV